MNNTIILKHCEIRLTREEFKKFKNGDSICGEGNYPVEELKRWDISDRDEAKRELEKHHCTYKEDGSLNNIEEYALEYCECDEDGEFVQGSDFEFAKEV